MPVKQMEQPCWKPCAPGEKPNNDGMHWDAAERAAEYADPGETVLPFPAPCYAVICDGRPGQPCGETLEDSEEGWIVHLEDPEGAQDQAENNGWEVTSDGKVQCRDCIDEALAKVASTFTEQER
jgi:hypothetical protein